MRSSSHQLALFASGAPLMASDPPAGLLFGFSGSRHASPSTSSLLASVFSMLPAGSHIWAGCATGVDSAALSHAQQSRYPFRKFTAANRTPFALVSRSVRFVGCLASYGGRLFSLPGGPYSPGPQSCPSSSWVSTGSGTWSSYWLHAGVTGGGRSYVHSSFIPSNSAPPLGWAWVSSSRFPGWVCIVRGYKKK